MVGDVASEASESVGDRQNRSNGAEDERSEDESGVDKGSMEGTEKVGESIYRSDGANRPESRERGRFVAGDEAERFWSYVTVVGDCWVWAGRRTTDGRYGRFTNSKGREVRAHRWLWEQTVGPIGPGLTLDHLVAPDGPCTTGLCVRPSHLEDVTNAENLRRRHARQRTRTETER